MNAAEVRIECSSSVDRGEWDALAAGLGGSLFHCHAHGLYESRHPHTQPLFVRCLAPSGQVVGVAVGTIATPRLWPFSARCRTASFGALPAARPHSPEMQRILLSRIESTLVRTGVYSVRVAAYDSPSCAEVLTRLSYQLEDRVEFYLDLSPPLEEIRAGMKGSRRTDIRKAEKLGVSTRLEAGADSCAVLRRLHASSMERRGIRHAADDESMEDVQRSRLIEQERAILLVTYCAGEAVNAAMFGFFGERGYYLYSGSTSAGNRCAGPVHLLWSAIEVLKSRGVKVLNMGGVLGPAHGAGPLQGLYSFKRDFGGEVVSQPRGAKVLSSTGATLAATLEWMKHGMGR